MKNKSYTCPRPYSKELILKGEGCGQILNTDMMKMEINRNSPSVLVGMQNGTTTLRDSLEVSYKTKHTLSTRSSSGFYSSKLKFYGHKNLNMDIYISFIHNFIWTKEPLDESGRGEWKSWLKTQHPENEDHGIWSHHFMANRETVETVIDFIWGRAPKSLQMVTAAMKLKDACSLEEKLWPT